MIKLYIQLIILSSPILIFAQEKDSTRNRFAEQPFIEKFDDLLALKLDLNNNIETFEVNSDPNTFILSPNTELNTRLTVNYRFITFSLGYSPNFLPGNNDNSRKGTSKISSFGVNFQFNKWIQALSYNKINGFFLKNTSDYVPDWTGSDDYIQFPELEYKSFFGLTGYKFNPNFSLKALSSQTERQLKSTGSFIPSIWYRYYIIDNKIELTGENSSQKSNNFEAVLQLGYYYTYVINKKFYSSAGISFGGGLVHTKLLTRLPEEKIQTKSTNGILRSEGQIAMGYNTKRFFTGIQFIGRWEEYSQGSSTSTIVNNNFSYQIFVGYRFNAPKFLSRTVDKIPLVN